MGKHARFYIQHARISAIPSGVSLPTQGLVGFMMYVLEVADVHHSDSIAREIGRPFSSVIKHCFTRDDDSDRPPFGSPRFTLPR